MNDTDPPARPPLGTPEPGASIDDPAEAVDPAGADEPAPEPAPADEPPPEPALPEPAPADEPPAEPAGTAPADEPPLPAADDEPPAGPAPAPEPATGGEPPASSGSVHRQNRIAIVGTVALVVALAIGAGYLLGRGTSTGDGGVVAGIGGSPGAGATPDPSASVPTPPASTGPVLPSDGNRLGNADAKVVIDYWADYQCPFCERFAQETIPLLTPYIADGTVALVHRDYAFIGPESIDAAIAVRCAGREGKYWPMHDAVYAAQDGENKGAFARDRLAVIAASVGIDAGKLDACFADRSLLAEVLADTAAGVRTAIESTPTVDVNGTRFLGVPKFDEVKAAIDAAVAGATPAPLPTQRPLTDPWAGTRTDGRTAGIAAAPVTVALWMDYQSTNGAAITKNLGEGLRTRVADGKVRLELHDLALLGDESVVAGVALRCFDAHGGPTWLISDVLSVSAQGKDAGIYTPANLLRLASQLGLDVAAIDSCLADPAVAQAVRDDTAAGKVAGLTEGPAIVVSSGGKETARFAGALDAARVLAAIDAAK